MILRFLLRTGLGCMLTAGCASTVSSMDTSPVAGWKFQMAVKYPAQQRYELFRIIPNGEIQYGGGMNAMNDTTSWESPLTPEQAKEFTDMMDALPWVKETPVDRGDSKSEPIMVVKFQPRGGSERNFTLYGKNAEAEKVIAFMKKCTLQRYEPLLQKLPEATEKPPPPKSPPVDSKPAPELRPAAVPPSKLPPAPTPQR